MTTAHMKQPSLRRPLLILLGCLIVVGWLDNPADYDPQPGPNARVLQVQP